VMMKYVRWWLATILADWAHTLTRRDAAFFVGGNGQTAAELGQLKGQMVAIEQASIAKKCNIQFERQ
jgi:hypothetical protein